MRSDVQWLNLSARAIAVEKLGACLMLTYRKRSIPPISHKVKRNQSGNDHEDLWLCRTSTSKAQVLDCWIRVLV